MSKSKKQLESFAMKLSSPLQWPEGDWPRTLPEKQRANKQWGMTLRQSLEALEKELLKMKVLSCVVSTNIPETVPGSGRLSDAPPRDPGVAVYFSRKRAAGDFKWRDILSLKNPYPTTAEVDDAYRELAAKYHPQGKAPDTEMFILVTKQRDIAKAWIEQKENLSHDTVMPCDLFSEVRWNVTAIRLGIGYLRGMERCGVSSFLDRAFKGFAALPSGG